MTEMVGGLGGARGASRTDVETFQSFVHMTELVDVK